VLFCVNVSLIENIKMPFIIGSDGAIDEERRDNLI